MPAQEFFERLLPRFALQAGAVKEAAAHQADAERLIAKAEYECSQMRRELLAAWAVPLRDRAVEMAEPMEPTQPVEPAPVAQPPARAAKAA